MATVGSRGSDRTRSSRATTGSSSTPAPPTAGTASIPGSASGSASRMPTSTTTCHCCSTPSDTRPTVAAERLLLHGGAAGILGGDHNEPAPGGPAVVITDGDHPEHAAGHVVVEGTRISAVGPGQWPGSDPTDATPTRGVDGRGCVLTPGLVNTHHHLYQRTTRGLAEDSALVEWLTTLYPVWAGLDEETVGAV